MTDSTSSTKERIERLSSQGSYRNSRTIEVGGMPFSVREILVTAPLIAGLNVYLVGGTGEGKTQLANDLAGLFGDSYCYAEGRPDFEPSEILKQLNLDLRGKRTDKELVELTENTRKNLFYVDELNRCPPIIMNYFFNFFDGKLVHNGKVYRLGKNNYAIGFASGNIGDGAYVGTEDTDRALKDRMHMIVKIDDPQFCTTEKDDWEIFGAKKDPRATLPAVEKACLDDILALHEKFNQRELPAVLQALGIYFHKGLDYLGKTVRNSKRAVDQTWPNVQGINTNTDESKIFPLSKRAVLATIGLSQALEMIAEARGHKVDNTLAIFLDALRFTVPYSGVLSTQFVNVEKGGDNYAAFGSVMESIRKEVKEKKSDLETAIAYAQFGEKEETVLDKISPNNPGRWYPVRKAIESLADNPQLDKTTLGEIVDDYKKPK